MSAIAVEGSEAPPLLHVATLRRGAAFAWVDNGGRSDGQMYLIPGTATPATPAEDASTIFSGADHVSTRVRIECGGLKSHDFGLLRA